MISIGVDTGLTNAFTVLEQRLGQRPRFVSKRTIAIGYKAKLSKPRRLKGKGKDGADGRWLTEETVIDDNDLREFWEEVRTVFESPILHAGTAPTVVTVERSDKVYERARFGGSMGTGLVRAAWLGGEIASIARFIFGPSNVATIQEADWRESVIGGHSFPLSTKGASDDQKLAAIIPAIIEGWPETSNNHDRDGGGVALAGARRAHLLQATKVREELNALPRQKPLVGHGALCPGMACKMPAAICARALRPIAGAT